jgi:uncharacterized protein with PIN domain
MIATPVEVGWIAKTLGFFRKYVGQVFAYGKRIATLEDRVTQLETRLSKQPGNACQYCGELVMRLTKQYNMVKGDHPKRWTEETWTCGVCNQNYTKRFPV